MRMQWFPALIHIRESLGDEATDDELIELIHNFHVLSTFFQAGRGTGYFVSVCTVFSIVLTFISRADFRFT